MKKFLKFCLIVGLICVGAGIAASAAGISLGGLTRLKEQIMQGEWSYQWESTLEQEPFFTLEPVEYFDKSEVVHENSGKEESAFPVADVEEIHVKAAGVTVNFMTHNGNEILVHASKTGKFQNYVKERELVITVTAQTNMEMGEAVVEILVPESMCDTRDWDMELEANACAIDLGTLALREAELNVNAGAVYWNSIQADSLSIEMLAGAVNGQYIDILREADIEMRAGSVELKGSLGVENDLKIMAGKIGLQLTNAYTDFNYDISCAGGNVILDKEEVKGVGKEFKKNNNAQKNIEIECSAGTVGITFS